MTAKKSSRSNGSRNGNGNGSGYLALEHRLVLASWVQRQFGYAENRDLLQDLAQADEGFDGDGRSFVLGRLVSRGEKCLVPREDLELYDANVRHHLAHINRRRTQPVTLRYFQHFALLATELYLDRLFREPANLLADLNRFVRDENIGRPVLPHPEFAEGDLRKLAFWMATGSGKTLLFHIHYRQYLHYCREPIDNILLITPNANLTAQHLEEMVESDIPCERFQIDGSGLGGASPRCVRVIEITKLVDEKKGSGESVPVEQFEGNNLIFVDEGHKGTGSEAESWRRRRTALAATGFTFEYSATFGQALDASKRDEVTNEYAKSILVDYSYRYFHGDGFGKNFHILNVREIPDREAVDRLLLGNLLSFYEQRRYFEEHRNEIRPYHLESPLWLLVGSKVTTTQADTLTVIRFLGRFLPNAAKWAEKGIQDILNGGSGISTTDGHDLFEGQLSDLREVWGANPDAATAKRIYHDVLRRVFGADTAGDLEIFTVKNAKGEVGLRVSGTERYFGLVYIGDAPKFRKLIEREAADLRTGEDAVASPLFPTVKQPESGINLLIGAKKFMEGWSSWRVANMGLLNIGVSEGSEIIQLFGRGVRLQGLNRSLKRSEALPDIRHPHHLKLLETLHIFAIRANYMENFRKYLEREGVPTSGFVTFTLDLDTNAEFLQEGLCRPRLPEDQRFEDCEDVVLSVDPDVSVRLDVTTRVRALHAGSRGGVEAVEARGGASARIQPALLGRLDWNRLHLDLMEHKEARDYRNLAVPVGAAQAILSHDEPVLYELTAPQAWLAPASKQDWACLQETASSLLRKYMDKYYRQAQQRWESRHLQVDELRQDESNFQPYTISVPRCDPYLVRAVEDIIKEAKEALSAKKSGQGPGSKKSIYHAEMQDLPNIRFDRHLYQPLLVARPKTKAKAGAVEMRTSPKGLEESERIFVEDLRAYCKAEANGALKGKQLFLLRNLVRGKGIGFFESKGFYPDFILWIKQGRAQRVIFVEPHGLLLDSGISNEKLRLHEHLQAYIAPSLEKAKLTDVSLDAFVISKTPYGSLHRQFPLSSPKTGYWTREDFREHHVLFQEERSGEYDYVRTVCG